MEIHHTLSRFHKIAERLRTAITEQVTRLESAVAPQHLDFTVLALRVETLRTKAEGYEHELQRLADLEDAYATVRQALAAANVSLGLGGVLLQQESTRRRIEFFTRALADLAGSVSFEEAEVLQQQRDAVGTEQHRFRSAPPVHLLSATRIAEMESALASLQRQATKQADRLADLNATKITVTLPDSVSDLVG